MSVTFTPVRHAAYKELAAACQIFYNDEFSVLNPSNCVLPDLYKNDMNRIFDFEVREDDVWVVSYPKCGTTWTQEMVWLLVNDLDYKTAKEIDLPFRSPFIEMTSFRIPLIEPIDWIDDLNKRPSPRCIKSHLPKDLLPRQLWTKKPKIIYVARNPKDVLVSYWSHHRSWMAFKGSVDTFADAFLSDTALYGPYWKHVIDVWKYKEPHVLFNTYEEMKQDLPGVIRKTAAFLNKTLTDEQVVRLAEHLSFSSMKENKAVNYTQILEPLHKEYNVQNSFMRRGESGAWKKDMPANLGDRVDAWWKEKLAGSDFPFYK